MITGKKRLKWLSDHGVVEPRKRNENPKEPKIKVAKEPRERKTRNPYDLRSQDALDYAVSIYSEIGSY